MIVKVCNNTVKPVTPIAVVGSSQSEDVTNEEEIRIEKLKAERMKRAQELVEKNRKDKIQEEAKVDLYFIDTGFFQIHVYHLLERART